MLNISAEHKKEHLYLEVYHYYRKLILEGRYPPKSVIPVSVDPVHAPGVFHFDGAVASA